MQTDMRQQRILITGASSGLGATMACHYARPGTALLLWGRDRERLMAVADTCRASGAETEIHLHDLTDSAGAVAAMMAQDQEGAIDLAVFAAGLGDIRSRRERVEDPMRVIRLGLVNFVAPCAMAAAIGGAMTGRGRGHIILIGSAAAFHALPFAAAYAGSKAGLARFAQALRIDVAPYGVRVLLASPGPIDTPAGRTVPAPAALTMQPALVASRIARASAQGHGHLILPWPFAALRLVDRLLPRWLRDRLLRALGPG